MSEFSFGTEVVDETTQQQEASAAEPGTLAMSADEFSALEERVLRAVNLVKRERLARAAAEESVAAAEAKIADHEKTIEHLHGEVDGLKSEREQVRMRVDRLLSQLDELEV